VSRADTLHRTAQERLAAETARRLAALIGALPEPGEQAAMDAYAPAAARVVAGGQHKAATLGMAYVGRLAPRAPGKAAPTAERALAGVLVDETSPVARSPVLRMWKRLGEGVDVTEAKREAASYAEELGSNDLQVAERGGLQEAARASGRKIKGWRKVLSSSPCEWCRSVAGAEGSSGQSGRYHQADSVPFHERDQCGVAPVFES
jgi:hypothetical protein